MHALRKSSSEIPISPSTPSLDKKLFVIHTNGVNTNVRTFLRDFARFKARARRGETVRVKDREGEFLFTAGAVRKSLLGAAKGKIVFHEDLTKPTLPKDGWKPSL